MDRIILSIIFFLHFLIISIINIFYFNFLTIVLKIVLAISYLKKKTTAKAPLNYNELIVEVLLGYKTFNQ